MAVARLEMDIPELEELLTLVGRPPRGTTLYRARREIDRALKTALEIQAHERRHMAEIRARRRVPGFDEEPLIPQRRQRA